MSIRPLLKMGHPHLLRQAQPVAHFNTPELHALLQDMFDTMAHAGGVGLAAPQIDENWQVVVFEVTRSARYPEAPPVPRTVLINPQIEPLPQADGVVAFEEGWEGCLSVPGLRGKVPRWQRIRYTGWDERGQRIEREAEGFHARVVQHECDHLLGRLYPTRMTDLTQLGFTSELFPELSDTSADD
jgi:peptide deformylase